MSYRNSFIFLLLAWALYFSPVLLKSQVIFPHPNDYEVSGQYKDIDEFITNRKFSDQSSVYIPEINHHLNGEHQNWISTWNPHVQVGRPTFQLSGFGKAYLATNLISLFTKNPFILYTLFTSLTVLLTGVFFFFYLRTLSVSPLACLVSSVGLSLGVFTSYWLTFIMFLSTICWTTALLWLTSSYVKHQTWPYALGISFSVYSILMTGYPQFIIMCSYIILINLLAIVSSVDWSKKRRFLIASAISLLILSGALMALPTFLDVFINVQNSARLEVSDDFFLGVLPKFKTTEDFLVYILSIIDSFWIGNPIRENFSVKFDGLSLSPAYSILLISSFLICKPIAKFWYWKIFIILCFFGTVSPSVYLFAVHHLGFNLSRSQMLGGAIIPAFILIAYSIDYFLLEYEKDSGMGNLRKFLIFVLPGLGLLGSQVYLAVNKDLTVNLYYIVLFWLILFGTSIFLVYRKKLVLIFILFISIFVYSYSLALFRPLSTISTSSDLVGFLQGNSSSSFRFVSFGSEMLGIIPPNQESLLNLESVHSYDSLSSRSYQKVVTTWSKGETMTYGRFFFGITDLSKISSIDFRLSGISFLLTKKVLLNNQWLKEVSDFNGVKVYEFMQKPILHLHTTRFTFEKPDSVVLTSGHQLLEDIQNEVTFIDKLDDYLKVQLSPLSGQSLLFLSQQFHPLWKATSGKVLLDEVVVNGFYQGVIIPPGTTEVSLEFRPFVLWSWIPQVFYVVLFLVMGYLWAKKQPTTEVVHGLR
jgi:hypothetical protein